MPTPTVAELERTSNRAPADDGFAQFALNSPAIRRLSSYPTPTLTPSPVTSLQGNARGNLMQLVLSSNTWDHHASPIPPDRKSGRADETSQVAPKPEIPWVNTRPTCSRRDWPAELAGEVGHRGAEPGRSLEVVQRDRLREDGANLEIRGQRGNPRVLPPTVHRDIPRPGAAPRPEGEVKTQPLRA
jgi:hypothetical protein